MSDLEVHREFQTALRRDLKRASRLLRRIEDAALRRLDRAQLDHVRGRHRAAHVGYQQAAAMFRRRGDDRGALVAAMGGVQIAALLGNAAAVRSWRRRHSDSSEPMWLNALGSSLNALGDETAAEACFREAASRGLGVVRATARQNLGLRLARRGALQEARRVLEQATREFERAGHEASAEIVAHNLAWVAALRGDTWAALSAYRVARDRFERRGDRRRAALVAFDEAELFARLGDRARATARARSAARALRTEAPLEAARAQLLLARLNGRKASARRARAMFHAAGDRAGQAAADVLLGEDLARAEQVLRECGHWFDALEALLKRNDSRALRRHADRYPRSLRRWLRPEILRVKAQGIAGLRGAWRAAEQARTLAPTARLRATTLLLHLPAYEGFAVELLRRGWPADLREAFVVIDSARARTLLEEIERETPGAFDHPAVRKARQRLDSLWREVDQHGGLRKAFMDRGEREFLAAVTEHETPIPVRAQGVHGLPVRPTVAYAVLAGRVHGLFWDGTAVRAWDCGTLGRLRARADEFRFQVTRRLFGQAEVEPAASCLRELEGLLLDDGPWPDSIAVVPLPQLGDVPFEALPAMADTVVVYTPCARWTSPRWKPGAALAVGVDDTLESVAAELKLVPNATGLSNPEREEILGALRGRRLVHFAGHAVAHDQAPSLSALRLRNGWLTASDLRPGSVKGALVVLSACRTGDPSLTWFGEALAGFPRALLAAGAAGVVASRWDVPDEAAHAWMRAFYAALDLGPARAVHAAARCLQKEGRHAAEWASFLLIQG